jgi:hypothetical protein
VGRHPTCPNLPQQKVAAKMSGPVLTSDPNKAAEQIKEGVKTRNGKIVWAGADACALWVEKGNGTIGPVSAQTSSMSQLLRWKWKSVKPIATGILNSASSYALTRLSLGRPEESFQRAGHQHRERRSPSAYLCISSSGDEVIEDHDAVLALGHRPQSSSSSPLHYCTNPVLRLQPIRRAA